VVERWQFTRKERKPDVRSLRCISGLRGKEKDSKGEKRGAAPGDGLHRTGRGVSGREGKYPRGKVVISKKPVGTGPRKIEGGFPSGLWKFLEAVVAKLGVSKKKKHQPT